MRKTGWLLALLAVLLLAGCEGLQKPVSGPETSSSSAAGKTEGPAATNTPFSPGASAEVSPDPSPSAAPAQFKPYSFPMKASALCGGAPLPDGFLRPLYINENGSMFLYATEDGRIAREFWDGAAYHSLPLVEGVDAGAAAYADMEKGRLCGAGSKLYAQKRTGPSIVVVDMRTGARGYADDLTGWKETDCALSENFQYCGGKILAQIVKYKDGKYDPLDRWVLMDAEAKTCSVLDLSGFREKNLQDWQETLSYRLALAGADRLLYSCLARRVNAETGGEEYACFVYVLDMKGRAQDGREATSAGKTPPQHAIAVATAFDASPDGKYLLYSDAQGRGLYLYDPDAGIEYTVFASDKGARVFAQWGQDGDVYYGAAGPGGEITIDKTNVGEIMKTVH